ncbi:MAG: Ig-like domain-containing protein [Lachnospiraceae bacterium]|nr:Ig-like domain-containing protein [Lachnospiraceae bacterium]
MKKRMTKLLSLLLIMAMLCTGMDLAAFAGDLSGKAEAWSGKDSNVVGEIILDGETDGDVPEAEPADPEAFRAEAENRIAEKASGEEAKASATSSYTVGNDIVEFHINGSGHLTIGTTGGLPNSTEDNNKKLIFGHPGSSTSHTTVRVNGKDYNFESSNTTYDHAGLRATTSMMADGVLVTQTLQIVENNGKKDTVQISYSYKNTTTSPKSVGVRIMLDTMLGDNDGSPFKIPSIGNLTHELEMAGNAVPQYWQAFDKLTNPSIFAVGTVFKSGDRRPDKVQFASWPMITGTLWDYTCDPSRELSHGDTRGLDSAVALYWNPVRVGGGASGQVRTYYGVGRMTNDGGIGTAPAPIDPNAYTFTVMTGSGSSCSYLEGADVELLTFAGDQVMAPVKTDANGQARFDMSHPIMTPPRPKYTKVKISKPGFKTKYIAGLVLENGKGDATILEAGGNGTAPYISGVYFEDERQKDENGFSTITDLMHDNKSVTIYEDENDPGCSDGILKVNHENGTSAMEYRLIQNNEIVYRKIASGQDIAKKEFWDTLNLSTKLKQGHKLYLQIADEHGKASQRVLLGILTYSSGNWQVGRNDPSNKSELNLFGKDGIKYRLPSDFPVVGGTEVKVDLPDFPASFDVDETGKVRFQIGYDAKNEGKGWENASKDWDEMKKGYEKALKEYKKAKTRRERSLLGLPNGVKKQKTKKWLDGVEVDFSICGYGEGKLNQDTGMVDIEIGAIVKLSGSYEIEKTYPTAIVPIAVSLKIEVGAEGQPQLKFAVGRSADGSIEFFFNNLTGKFTISLTLGLYAGPGIAKFVSAQVGGDGTIGLDYQFWDNYWKVWVSLDAYIKLKALMVSVDIPLFHGEKDIADGYAKGPSKNGSKADASSLEDTILNTAYDESAYDLMSRDYLRLSGDGVLVSSVDGSVEVQTTRPMESVFINAQPQSVQAGDKTYIFYLMDVSDRESEDRTALAYITTEDGKDFTDPVIVLDDGTADFNFALAAYGNDVYVAWQNAKETYPSGTSSIHDFAAKSEIWAARISGGIVTAASLTDNDYADIMPGIACTASDTLEVSWISVSDNKILEQTEGVALHGLTVDFSGTQPAAGAETGKALDKPAASLASGLLYGTQVTALTLDGDRDFTTPEDQDLYLWNRGSGELTQVTGKAGIDGADEEPHFDSGKLYWYHSGNIRKLENIDGEASEVFAKPVYGLSANFAVCGGTLAYLGTDTETSEKARPAVYEVSMSGEDLTDPLPRTALLGEAGSAFSSLSVTPLDLTSRSITVMNTTPVESGDSVIETAKLLSVRREDKPDLAMDALLLDQNRVQPDTPLSVSINVTNKGAKSAAVNIISVQPENGEAVQCPVADAPVTVRPGESRMLTISYPVPEDLTKPTKTVFTVKCDDDAVQEDNSMDETIGYPDLTVKVGRYLAGNKYFGNITIENLSGISANDVILRVFADGTDGAIVYENFIEGIGGYEAYSLQADLLKMAASRSVEDLYFVVSSGEEEYYDENNIWYEYIRNLWSNDEKYFVEISQPVGGKLSGFADDLYAPGVSLQVRARALKGYDFKEWVADGDGVFEDIFNPNTRFTVGDENTVISAIFEPNAFKEKNLNRSLCVGEALLITPVYDGTWSISGNEGEEVVKLETRKNGELTTQKVTALTPGNVSLTYTPAEGLGFGVQHVNIHVYAVDSFTVSSDAMKDGKLIVRLGSEATVGVECYSTDGTLIADPDVAYSTSSPKTAYVDTDGVVHAMKPGKFVLKAKIGSLEQEVEARVIVPVTAISIKAPNRTYYPEGTRIALKAALSGVGKYKPTDSGVGWGIDYAYPEKAATLKGSTLDLKEAGGSVTLRVSANDGYGAYDSRNVEITKKVKSLTLGTKKYTGNVGNTTTLYATIKDVDGGTITSSAAAFSSSNSKVASVADNGYVTLRKAGTATITASYGGKSAKCTVKVKKISTSGRVINAPTGQKYVAAGSSAAYKISAKGYKIVGIGIVRATDVSGNDIDPAEIASVKGKTLTAKNVGRVYIGSKYKSKKYTYTYGDTEVILTPRAKELAFEAGQMDILSGGTANLAYTATGADDEDVKPYVTFSTSNRNVATVEAGGVVTGIKPGTVTIKAVYGKKTASIKVRVLRPVQSVDMACDHQITVNKETELKTEVLPKNATVKTVSFNIIRMETPDGKVVPPAEYADYAKVTNGRKPKITASKKCTIRLEASAADGSGVRNRSLVLQVTDPIKSLALSANALERLAIGDVLSVESVAQTENGETIRDPQLYLQSSNKKILQAFGTNLTGMKYGSSNVTAVFGGKKVKFKVKVLVPVEEVQITGPGELMTGETVMLKASLSPAKQVEKQVSWRIEEVLDSFGDPVPADQVAEIDQKGRLKTKGKGTILVTAEALDGYGAQGQHVIRIYDKPVELKLFARTAVRQGDRTLITLVATDRDGDTYVVRNAKWRVDGNAVKVKNGMVTALKKGKATVEASVGSMKQSIVITVK